MWVNKCLHGGKLLPRMHGGCTLRAKQSCCYSQAESEPCLDSAVLTLLRIGMLPSQHQQYSSFRSEGVCACATRGTDCGNLARSATLARRFPRLRHKEGIVWSFVTIERTQATDRYAPGTVVRCVKVSPSWRPEILSHTYVGMDLNWLGD